MATKETTKTATKTTRTRSTTKSKATTAVKKEATTKKATVKKPVRIAPDTMLTVVSNCLCPLTYTSKRLMGYTIEWEGFGSIQYMEYQEVVAMHNTDLRFFEDNWVVIEPTDEYTSEEIYEALRVDRYYKNYVSIDTIDDLLSRNAAEIKTEVSKFSSGMKDTIRRYAEKKQSDGDLDSMAKIEALKEALGINEM